MYVNCELFCGAAAYERSHHANTVAPRVLPSTILTLSPHRETVSYNLQKKTPNHFFLCVTIQKIQHQTPMRRASA